jgi:PAS domain S-box-containing protein
MTDGPGSTPRLDRADREYSDGGRTALPIASDLLRLALDAGGAVGWEWDLKNGRLLWFGSLQTMFGLPSNTFLGRMEDFRARVHPADRANVSAAVAEAMKRRAPYSGVFRVVTVDGRVRWVSSRGEFLFAADGSAERMLGIAVDITDRRETEHRLRERERALTEAQRLAGLGSWEWNPLTDTVWWSEELYRLAGLDPSGPPVSYADHHRLYTPESWARLQSAVEEALRSCQPYELDLEMVLPDGRTRWLHARGEALRDAGGRIVRLRGTVHDITERRRAEQALSALGRRLIESQEAERVRVARELHDDVGQRLAMLSVALDRHVQGGDGSYEDLRAQLLSVQSVIHNLSHELHATPLRHLGLARAVRGFCAEVASVHDVEVDVREGGDVDAADADASLCLFRVLQESLHNAVRHSGVRRFGVSLAREADAVTLSVGDEGAGFDAPAAMSGGGLGLVSMQERLKLVQGELTIDSAPGRGTVIRARIPCTAADGRNAETRASDRVAGT